MPDLPPEQAYLHAYLFGPWRRYLLGQKYLEYSSIFDLILAEMEVVQEDLAWALVAPLVSSHGHWSFVKQSEDFRAVRVHEGQPIAVAPTPPDPKVWKGVQRILSLEGYLNFCRHEEYLRSRNHGGRVYEGSMIDLKPFFTIRMWKMSSYNWYGIWMRADGQSTNQDSSGPLDTHALQVVGQVKFGPGERDGLEDRIAAALHQGGWVPGGLLKNARRALKQHLRGYTNES